MTRQAQVVLITDADSPSGKAFIQAFSAAGAKLALNSPSKGAAIGQELDAARSFGIGLFIGSADLTDSVQANMLLEEAEQELGPLDVLIHNDDAYMPALIETCEEQTFLAVMDANAKTAFVCTQQAGRRMAERESGCILYLTSIHAEKPTGSSFAYSSSKGAVKMLSKEAALYWGRSGIRVNTIEMGPVEGASSRFPSTMTTLYDNYEYKVPSGKAGRCEDAAKLALFLCSEEAGYVNGADIRLDGGFLLHYMDHKMKRPRPGDRQ
ncbi:SDR family NAD(P)-dependent oxidoreductase [Paenibacillus protaetiae]|uniref:SDR family oxidoreductase n=1 Tax=Paenibacillus protaetiae TaxID=2509456 RepID=A0A4P6ES78_9BACL|nr:SDR family oxidoreductase [Paenibacillus protaetiae]QAY65950.1 SDR family oxidoreductase [Paenibacillus protaetiae]